MIDEAMLRSEDLGRPEPPGVVLDRLEAAGHARHGFYERCWGDAWSRAQAQPSRPQTEHYFDILAEVEART